MNMDKYYRKIYLYIFGAIAIAVVLFAMNSGLLIRSDEQSVSFQRSEPVDTLSQADMEASTTSASACP